MRLRPRSIPGASYGNYWAQPSNANELESGDGLSQGGVPTTLNLTFLDTRAPGKPQLDTDQQKAIAEGMKVNMDGMQLRGVLRTFPSPLPGIIVLGLMLALPLLSFIVNIFLKKRTTPVQRVRRTRKRTMSAGTAGAGGFIVAGASTKQQRRRSRMMIANRLSVVSARSATSGEYTFGSAQQQPQSPTAYAAQMSWQQQESGTPIAEIRKNMAGQRVSFVPPAYGQPFQSQIVYPQPTSPTIEEDPESESYKQNTNRFSAISIATVATSPPILEQSNRRPSFARSLADKRRSWLSFAGLPADAEAPILHIRPRRSPGTFVVAFAAAEDDDIDGDEDDWWEDEEVWGDVEVLDDRDVIPPVPNLALEHPELAASARHSRSQSGNLSLSTTAGTKTGVSRGGPLSAQSNKTIHDIEELSEETDTGVVEVLVTQQHALPPLNTSRHAKKPSLTSTVRAAAIESLSSPASSSSNRKRRSSLWTVNPKRSNNHPTSLELSAADMPPSSSSKRKSRRLSSISAMMGVFGRKSSSEEYYSSDDVASKSSGSGPIDDALVRGRSNSMEEQDLEWMDLYM
ncbi:hypothetical protein DFS34DRAFT_514346 [Phlyctochytrium arcticum]|nr:hypothetical protein DFS34DRAFT_514346 [Phlyctochytrium arcticum]